MSARLVSGGVDREWGQEKKEKKKRRRNNDAIAGKHPATCDATTRFGKQNSSPSNSSDAVSLIAAAPAYTAGFTRNILTGVGDAILKENTKIYNGGFNYT